MTAVLFDLEGTLVDFQWRLAAAESRARDYLDDLGYERERFADASYAELYNAALRSAAAVDEDPAAVRAGLDDIYDEFDADALDRWRLREGARTAVARAEPRGLVTNVGRRATRALLDRTNLAFDVVLTRDDVDFLKPDPSGLERATARLAGEPIFVGDSVTDVRAGHAAGLRVAVVTGGESDDDALAAAGPEYRLAGLAELAAVTGE